MIGTFKNDNLLAEVESNFPGSKVKKINGKTLNPNIRVCDLVDDLYEIYKIDNSKEAQKFKKQQRQNQLFIDKFILDKGLKK